MPVKEKKSPMRMCVGCREMKPKRELIRVVKAQDKPCAIDRVGKAPGRGAYVCPDSDCLKKAVKTRALERALECPISQDVYEELSRQLEEEA